MPGRPFSGPGLRGRPQTPHHRRRALGRAGLARGVDVPRTLAAGRPLSDPPRGCSAPPGWAGAGGRVRRGSSRGSYPDSHTPGWHLPVGLAAPPKRAQRGEAPSPRRSFIPALTRAPATHGEPFRGPHSFLEGSGRLHGSGQSEARLPGAHDPAQALPHRASCGRPNPGPLDLEPLREALQPRRQRDREDRAPRKPTRWGRSAPSSAHAEGRLWCCPDWLVLQPTQEPLPNPEAVWGRAGASPPPAPRSSM